MLTDRDANEAYLAFIPGEQFANFFADGGEVGLDLRDVHGRFVLKWLDIPNSQWSDEDEITGGDIIGIKTPATRYA